MLPKVYETLEFYKIKNILETYAITGLGKARVQKLEPSTNSLEIKTWQAETTEATIYLLKQHDIPLSPIQDISAILKKISIGGILTIHELLLVGDVLRVSRRLKSSFRNGSIDSSTMPILSSYFENIYINQKVEEEFNRCIKNEDELDDRASQTLYQIRKDIKEAESKIKEKLTSILHTSAKYLQDTVVTIRNNRYVIPVKQEYKAEISGLVHDSSATGNTIFIEPTAVFQTNNEIQELKSKEQQEIERILGLLTAMLSPITEELAMGMMQIEKIDFAFAKGKYSLSLQAFEPSFCEPTVSSKIQKENTHFATMQSPINTNGTYGNLKKARHPLIDPSKVVPIDIWFGKDFQLLIITGPNTGGKTVTLKTVGLLSLMAQSGLHIPASEGSTLPIFQNIYTDIGDEQSIEQSLSTFSAHLTNLVYIINHVTPNDLVLIDEIGSGTDPVEGAALAMAILEFFHQMNAITIATTHYSELKTFAIKTPGIENASCEFDVESLQPTYRLLIGVPGKSNAFAISKKLGLKQDILTRASTFLSKETIKFEDVLSDMERNRRKAKEEREMSKQLLQEATLVNETAKNEKEKITKQKEEILNKARKQARDLLLDADEEAKEILRDLTNLKSKKEEHAGKLAEQKRLQLKKSIQEIQQNLMEQNNGSSPLPQNTLSVQELTIGMNVYLPSLEQEATVCKLPDKNGNVIVQAGIVKLTVPVSKLEKTKQITKKSNIAIQSKVRNKAQEITTEIKLLGMTVDEALPALEKYLDDAYLSGIAMVRVVHGKGTGALRKSVQDYLKRNPHVKSFRLGVYGEGDSGVTIVEMK